MEPVDEESHQDQQEEGDHHIDAHDVAVLFKRESEFLVRKEEVEHGPADHGGLVAGHGEEEPAIEREAETFAKIGHNHIVLLRFRRRILPLFHEEAHQQKRKQINDCDPGEDPRHVLAGMFEDKALIDEARNRPDHAEERHESPHELLRNHVRKDVIKDRSDEHVEELESDCKQRDAAENHPGRGECPAEDGVVQKSADLVAPPKQNQKQCDERTREKQIRNPPPPPGAGPVAARAHNRVDDQVQHRRNAPDNEADEHIRRTVLFHEDRQQRRDQRLHERETEIPPQHPDEEVQETEHRVFQRSDRVVSAAVFHEDALVASRFHPHLLRLKQ